MSVPDQVPLTSYTGNGVTTVFAYQFMLLEAEDAEVYLDSVLVSPTAYSVSGLGNQSGGNITFNIAPGNGVRVVLRRNVGLQRLIDYQYVGDFQSPTVNRDFDRLWMALQDYIQQLSTALRLPPDDTSNPILPPIEGRALMILGFDADGELTLFPPQSSSDATTLALLLASSALVTQGAGMVGYKPGTYAANTVGAIFNFLGSRTLATKVQEVISPADGGAVANGVVNDDAGFNAAKAIKGAVFVPADKKLNVSQASFNRVSSIVPAGSWVSQPNLWIADDGFAGQGALNAARATAADKDALSAEHFGSGTGYAVHGISYSTNGSGGGFACWGVGSGVVGNKRGNGAASIGNGVLGTRLENADGSGVVGDKQGTGSGHGVYGTNFSAGAGSGVLGLRQDGPGHGVYGLKQGSGTGDGVLAEHFGSGSGNGATITNGGSATGTGATVSRSGGSGDGVTVTADNTVGMALTAIKKVAGATKSIGYLGYWDNSTGESAAVYGAAVSGTINRAARFDGDTRTSGTASAGNSNPLADNTGTVGNASFRWQAVWAATGTINTSDRNDKTDIRELNDRERAVARRLRQLVRMFRFKDGGGHPGQRLHTGLIAQDVHQAFADEGLDAADYAMWCNDEIFEDVMEEDGFTIEQQTLVDEVEIEEEAVEIRDGRPVLVVTKKTAEIARTKLIPLLDEAGQPVMEPDDSPEAKRAAEFAQSLGVTPEVRMRPRLVAVAETIEVQRPNMVKRRKSLGFRQGLRYDQVLAFIIAAAL